MEEDRIVLDRKSFEALAVDTRVRILKSLKERRKTLSEIAKEQKMSVSGVKEHLETLEGVGLIMKMDDGHKWKYYELTRKGTDIVAPRELRVWILLSISVIALAASMTALVWPPIGEQALPEAAYGAAPEARMMAVPPEGAGQAADSASAKGAPETVLSANAENTLQASGAPDEEIGVQEPDLAVPLAVAAISSLTFLACAGILVRNRMRPASP